CLWWIRDRSQHHNRLSRTAMEREIGVAGIRAITCRPVFRLRHGRTPARPKRISGMARQSRRMTMKPEPAEDLCPHCGGPLYPSREEKMRRANFYSQLAAVVFIGGTMALAMAWHL